LSVFVAAVIAGGTTAFTGAGDTCGFIFIRGVLGDVTTLLESVLAAVVVVVVVVVVVDELLFDRPVLMNIWAFAVPDMIKVADNNKGKNFIF
jgi:hypothetical protein